MSGVVVKALSGVGQAAMEQIHDAGENERIMKKMGFVESIESSDPFIVSIDRKKKLARAFPLDHMVSLIEKQMASVGAMRDRDFSVEVWR